MSTKSSEMALIFSVVFKIFFISLPLRDTRWMLETVPSEDKNNSLEAREACLKNKTKQKILQQTNPTFAKSHHSYALFI